MSWTKRQLIEEAFTEIGYAAYSYDLDTDQLQAGLRRLDAMMAQWDRKGIKIGFPLAASPQDSDIDQETEVTDTAAEAIYSNLALKIAPMVGKMVSMDTKRSAKIGYNVLLGDAVKPSSMPLPDDLPLGSGNKSWNDRRYVVESADKLPLDGEFLEI